MMAGSLPLFLLCAFLAETIGTMAGFGAATILTPIAALFMDIKTAIAVVACFHLFGNSSRLFFFHRHVRWPIWWRFGLTGVVCSLWGASLTARLSSAAVEVLVGLFLMGYVVTSLVASERLRLPQKPVTLIGGGVVSGFVAGLIGTGGAIRSACLMVFALPKEAYIGTSAAIAIVVDATRVPVYVTGRFIPPTMVRALLGLMVVAFCGSWCGQRLVRRLSAHAFRRGVLALLTIMGLKLLIDGWHGLSR